MTQLNLGTNFPISIQATLTAATFLISSFGDVETMPSENYTPPILNISERAWEEKFIPTYQTDNQDIYEKMEIIHQFASKLVNESIDIPPEFATVINENFWELI